MGNKGSTALNGGAGRQKTLVEQEAEERALEAIERDSKVVRAPIDPSVDPDVEEARRIARSYSPQAVRTLGRIMRSPKSKPDEKRRAAVQLLEIGGVLEPEKPKGSSGAPAQSPSELRVHIGLDSGNGKADEPHVIDVSPDDA